MRHSQRSTDFFDIMPVTQGFGYSAPARSPLDASPIPDYGEQPGLSAQLDYADVPTKNNSHFQALLAQILEEHEKRVSDLSNQVTNLRHQLVAAAESRQRNPGCGARTLQEPFSEKLRSKRSDLSVDSYNNSLPDIRGTDKSKDVTKSWTSGLWLRSQEGRFEEEDQAIGDPKPMAIKVTDHSMPHVPSDDGRPSPDASPPSALKVTAPSGRVRLDPLVRQISDNTSDSTPEHDAVRHQGGSFGDRLQIPEAEGSSPCKRRVLRYGSDSPSSPRGGLQLRTASSPASLARLGSGGKAPAAEDEADSPRPRGARTLTRALSPASSASPASGVRTPRGFGSPCSSFTAFSQRPRAPTVNAPPPLVEPEDDDADSVASGDPDAEFVVKPEWHRAAMDKDQAALKKMKAVAGWRKSATSALQDDIVDYQLVIKGHSLLGRCISFPGSPYRVMWDALGALLIAYDLVMIPMKVFGPPENVFTDFMEWLTLCFWTVNIPTSMTVGYVRDGVTVMVPRKIALNYLRTWFLVDLVVVVPDWVFMVVGSGTGVSLRMLRIIRLARTLRLIRLLKLRWLLAHVNEYFVESEFLSVVFNIVKMIILLLAINHFIACTWYAIAYFEMDYAGTWVSVHGYEVGVDCDWYYTYFTSFHWSVTQFTPASMDVQPQNVPERVFAVLVVVFALVGFSYVVGSLTGSLAQLRSMQEDASKEFRSVRRYLRQNKVPVTLSLRVQKYVEHAWSKQKDRVNLSSIKMFDFLSEQLHNEVRLSMSVPHLSVHPLFFHLGEISTVTLHRLAFSSIGRKHFAQQDTVFFPGEVATHLSFVVNGKLKYMRIVEESGTYHTEWVDKGEDWIAEPVLWISHWVHVGVLMAAVECELLIVQPESFSEVVRLNPQVFQVVSRYARRYVRHMNQRGTLSDITQGEDESTMLEAFINNPLTPKASECEWEPPSRVWFGSRSASRLLARSRSKMSVRSQRSLASEYCR